MQNASLTSAFFNPASIAILGASSDPARIGGQLVANLIGGGYKGRIYPVNPKYPEIRGLRCYQDLAALPEPCELALIAVAAAQAEDAIVQCAAAGTRHAVVMSAGFRETGPEGAAREDRLKAAARQAGVRMLGPNCLGVMNLRERVYCGFGEGFRNYALQPGRVAFISQSGGFAFSVVALADAEGLRFNYIASTGNESDVTTLDLLEDLLEREDVDAVAVYMEGIADGRRLRALGRRALELSKPILIWKVGNSEKGRAAAASHTASMTAGYTLYKAAFAEGGFVEVGDVSDLVDAARAFLAGRLPQGPRVAVITTSGGSGVVITDACDRVGLQLPALAPSTVSALEKISPPHSVFDNPVDLTAQLGGNAAVLNQVTELVLQDPNVDQLIIRYNAVQGAGSEQWARGLSDIAARSGKPVHLAWSRVPDRSAPSLAVVESGGLNWALTPARAAHAAGALHRFAARRAARGRDDGTREFAPRRIDWPAGVQEGRRQLSESESKRCLAVYGIESAREVVLSPEAISVLEAAPLRFPLAVKIDSPDIAHKTEIGAVRLNVTSLEGLKQAAQEVWGAARRGAPDARLNGLLVAEMAQGAETIIGAVNDPWFGPLVMFGLGGVFTELLRDVSYRFAPFGLPTARDMIAEIAATKLLTGFRGRPAADTEALARTLSCLSLLVADHADHVAEIDLNPVFVAPLDGAGQSGEASACVADALIVLRGNTDGKPG